MKGRIPMSRARGRTASLAAPHPAPIAIAIDGLTVGLALRETFRFRFLSGHPRFDLLDGSRFSRIEDVQWAVRRLAHASAEPAVQAERAGAQTAAKAPAPALHAAMSPEDCPEAFVL
jgi:hypothetical protein